MDVVVPGEIHCDLQAAELIADVDTGTGALEARWVEEMLWSFRRTVEVPAERLQDSCLLVFERLELVARIVLNGQEVGRHANAFLPCRIDLTGKLKEGSNLLVVHLDSGLFDAADKPAAGYMGFIDQKLHKRHWLRTPQCQFGWDWSPRLMNVGITAPVRLEWTSAAVRVERMVPLVTVSDDLSEGRVRLRIVLQGLRPTPQTVVLTATLTGGALGAAVSVTVSAPIASGTQVTQLELHVPGPALWWPVHEGPQTLHALTLTVQQDGEELASAQARIGFRRARVVQSDLPEGGSTFAIEVNNRLIFAKGGNFVPADIIRARIDSTRYEVLIERALAANFNLLRVWGGGLYEADDFYALCDERGILVWQEFIFACARYPGQDEAFYQSVRAEAVHNIRRLAGHPSLVLWCGNNELEWAYWQGGEHGMVLPDHALFHHLLPRLLLEEDPTRHYLPSSPWSPVGYPNRDDAGNQHPWATTMADGEFRAYRAMTCRFANEGGILGPTALATVLECLPAKQRRFGSLAFRIHDNATEAWHEPRGIDHAFRAWTGKDPYEIPLADWVFWAGLLQGEGLREYCDNFRRRMFTSAASVFWMFNDCWPATRSWTIVDHRLRRTPSYHPVRRAMARTAVVLAIAGDEVQVFAINDSQEVLTTTLRYGVFRLSGGMVGDWTMPCTVPAHASTLVARFARSLWSDDRGQIAFAELSAGDALLARNRLILPRFSELAWPVGQPVVTITVAAGIATFACPVYVWGVCLDLDGELDLADNMFDLYPGIPYRMPWSGTAPPQIVRLGNLS